MRRRKSELQLRKERVRSGTRRKSPSPAPEGAPQPGFPRRANAAHRYVYTCMYIHIYIYIYIYIFVYIDDPFTPTRCIFLDLFGSQVAEINLAALVFHLHKAMGRRRSDREVQQSSMHDQSDCEPHEAMCGRPATSDCADNLFHLVRAVFLTVGGEDLDYA